jgi:hypothetical protein
VNRFTTYLVFLLTMSPLVWANAADVPYIMNYQGSVKATGGMPYDGNGYFKFAIVDMAGTTSYWSNDSTSAVGSEPTASVEVAVSNGLFSVKLGDVSITNMTTDLSGTVFDNTSTYIRTWFSDDDATFSQLSPDQQIVSTGHAIHAQSAETAVSKTGDTMTGALTVPSLSATGDITATGSINATGDGLVLDCINKALSISFTGPASSTLAVFGGAGTDTSTVGFCGAGYEVFQGRCVSGGGGSSIHLTQAGIFSNNQICTYYNSSTSSRTIFNQVLCCKGSW